MFLVAFLSLLLVDVAQADAKKSADKIPKELRELLKKGGWTPTPTNSARYQVGDVFDFSSNKELTKGDDCFSKLPKKEGMSNIEISRYLKGGFQIPLGLVKGKAKRMRYKRLTYANTEVQEFSEMQLEEYFQPKCRRFLRKRLQRSKDTSQIRLIKAVIQSTVNEQVCTSVDGSVNLKGFGVGAEKADKCEFDAEAPVTIAYQLIGLDELLVGSTVVSEPVVKKKPPVSSNVEVQGGVDSDFASLARKAKAAEEAQKHAKAAFEKAVKGRLDEAAEKERLKQNL